MNLQDTVRALEAKEIVVAIDIGVHSNCDLDSNCPLAIQLRRLIADAGITLEQLLEGYQEATAPSSLIDLTLPQFNATLHLVLGNKEIEVDFNDVASQQLRERMRAKLREVDGLGRSVQNLGGSLYQSYLGEIRKHRDNQALPQISFSLSELLETGCLVTSSDRSYVFLFPKEYNPQYIIRSGIRYKLLDERISELKCMIYLKFTITQAGKFLRADVLDVDGNKFRHYHGDNRYDCWGGVPLPERWEGGLASLSRLAHTLVMSLVTINYNSLLLSTPSNMPHVDELLGESTRLGIEGEIYTPVVEQPAPQPAERQGWGRVVRDRR